MTSKFALTMELCTRTYVTSTKDYAQMDWKWLLRLEAVDKVNWKSKYRVFFIFSFHLLHAYATTLDKIKDANWRL